MLWDKGTRVRRWWAHGGGLQMSSNMLDLPARIPRPPAPSPAPSPAL